MTKPDPAVEVPVGTSTLTKPETCAEGGVMELTVTPELEPPAGALLTALLLEDAALLLTAETVKLGGT